MAFQAVMTGTKTAVKSEKGVFPSEPREAEESVGYLL